MQRGTRATTTTTSSRPIRRRRGTAVVASVLVAALIAAGCASSTSDGPVAATEVAGDGRSIRGGAGPQDQPTQLWSNEVTCDSQETFCDLAADDAGVFAIVPTDDGSEVVAYAPDSGDELWSMPVAGESGLGILDGELYAFAFGEQARTLTQLDRTSGDETWSETLDDQAIPELVTVGGSVLVGRFAAEVDVTGYAAADGARRWTVEGSFLAACDDLLYLHDDGAVRLVDATSGDTRWSAEVPGESEVLGATCLADGVAVTTADLADEAGTTLSVYEASDGSTRWSTSLRVGEAGDLLVADEGVVVTGGSGGLQAFALDGGAEVWTSDTENGEISRSAAVDDKLLVASAGFEAALYDFGSGERLEGIDLAPEVIVDLVGDLMLVNDGTALQAYDTATLEARWALPATDLAWPAVGDERVFLLDGGTVTAYG